MLNFYKDNLEFENIGYNDCDSSNNGEFNVVDNIIKEKDVVFDIGANVGSWSKYVLLKSDKIFLNSFEPVKSTYDILCKNFINTNVKCYNYAVSKNNEDKVFYFYGPTLQLSELSTLYKRGDDVENKFNLKHHKINVKCITVDTFCKDNNINYIDFLKIDTEGAELDVLEGSYEMINNDKVKYIQFEYGGCYLDSNQTLKVAFDLLQLKYNIYRILSGGLLHLEKWNNKYENYLYSNYLAIKK
jgi:FkbM family methyltransferase